MPKKTYYLTEDEMLDKLYEIRLELIRKEKEYDSSPDRRYGYYDEKQFDIEHAVTRNIDGFKYKSYGMHEFLEKYAYHIPDELIIKYYKNFESTILSYNKKLSVNVIRQIWEISATTVYSYQNLTEQFRKQNNFFNKDLFNSIIDKVDWDILSWMHDLPTWVFHKYKDRLDWTKVSMCRFFSKKDLNTYSSYINWKDFSEYNAFSEDIFFEFSNKIDIHKASFFRNKWLLKENRSNKLNLYLEMNGIYLYDKR